MKALPIYHLLDDSSKVSKKESLKKVFEAQEESMQ